MIYMQLCNSTDFETRLKIHILRLVSKSMIHTYSNNNNNSNNNSNNDDNNNNNDNNDNDNNNNNSNNNTYIKLYMI